MRRLVFTAMLAAVTLLILSGATVSQAAPGALRILIVGNCIDDALRPAIAATPGVGSVDTFDSSSATPTAANLATYDLVVGTGNCTYNDATLWGDRLADYLDSGGVEVQFAYDNWDSPLAHPQGRFESGGYPPFLPGPNDNVAVTLGTLIVPDSPLLAGVPNISTLDNTTDELAPGATLLAKWSDDRNAIATKGRVVSVTAGPDEGSFSPFSAAGQLAVNAGNVLGPRTLTVSKSGPGSGTVTSSPAGISCGSTCATTLGGVGGFQSITLHAAATAGSFTGWSGGGCSGASTCTPTVVGPTTVTANFGGCVVPKVKGKRVKKAKKRLRNADCRLGKVKGQKGGKVKKQKPKPGTVLPVDSTVKVTLG
jgi:PASTA domain/Divergent InlB B-repeat domain